MSTGRAIAEAFRRLVKHGAPREIAGWIVSAAILHLFGVTVWLTTTAFGGIIVVACVVWMVLLLKKVKQR